MDTDRPPPTVRRVSDGASGALKVLFVTNMWPDEQRPWHGSFVKSQADSLAALGVEVRVLPIPGYVSRTAYLRAARTMARLNVESGYDVIHAHYGHSGVVARLHARAPLVVSYCGDDLLGTRTENGSLTVRSRVEAEVFRQLARVATATITKSAEMEEALPAQCRSRNHVIPNGVDLGRFARLGRTTARRRLDWPLDEPALLFVGDPRIAVKNHPLAAEVARRVTDRAPAARLRVANGLGPEEVPVWMAAADVLLFTSRSEGSPNVIKEAMAAELPIVSTAVGDVPERLRGLPGCFVGAPDAAWLADRVVEALGHGRVPQARDAVAAIGLAPVAERVLAVYEDVVQARSM